ncbi:hypothetical protein GCM10009808_14470 [Microbacterium sediminicola]|uniref:Large exoprotein n=1 Tax=Microbacterium sediminicola TaxID=415210 RepID=A0ABP4U4E5_9MICO
MDGQVLGGGVIVAVSVLLWLVYLVPSWYERRQFDASERNAVRLNQALRVLAETSETPEEVRLELSARTAQAQQREAKRALAERERLARQAVAEREQAAVETAREELQAARSLPAARRRRARRRARLLTTFVGIVALLCAAWGLWLLLATGAETLLWISGAVAVVCTLMLGRMAKVSSRAVTRVAPVAAAPAVPTPTVQDVSLPATRQWAPRSLPAPLTAAAGSRAAAMMDAEDARAALRQAAMDEAMRAKAAAAAPPTIEHARVVRERAQTTQRQTGGSVDFTRLGYVDDAEIEAHVRDLLARRAASA